MNPREYEIMFACEDAYWWYRGMRRVTRAFAPAVFARAAGARALDAGCGTGRNLVDLTAEGPAVGVDVSLRALGFARRRAAAPLVCASIEALPFPAGTFEAALSRDVFYMVPDDGRAARELARVLAPRGALALSVPAFDAFAGAHDVAVGALRRYTEKSLKNLLQNAGLAVARTSYANFFLSGPIWILRKVTGAKARGRAREEASSDFSLAPKPLEDFFFFILFLEAKLIAAHVRLPFGVTAFVLAEKPAQGTSVAAK
ncbi:MAG: class I SAM-dependent methyltransferase [Acidobacteriota bacterium]|nr:class I SAM-dependent methyltransferase [Acidobacteriota bacterium]